MFDLEAKRHELLENVKEDFKDLMVIISDPKLTNTSYVKLTDAKRGLDSSINKVLAYNSAVEDFFK